jgi:apolipoprotein N-acyltransferase
MKKHLYYLLAALSTGLLLHFAWPTSGFIFLLFVAFLPILMMERHISSGNAKRKSGMVFLYSWIAFALFNLTTTLWVKNAHVIGPIATTIINGALMALVITLFSATARKIGYKRAQIGLPFLWLCVEVLHQDWDLSFPWLDLGNAFATHIEWVQWYDKTGHMGGTLWAWMVNLLFFQAVLAFYESQKRKALLQTLFALAVIAVPILLSLNTYANYTEKGFAVDVVAVQPNIESFTEKWSTPESQQVEKFIRLAEPLLDSNVDLLVGPETLLGRGYEEAQMQFNPSVQRLASLANRYPNLNTVFGATTFTVFTEANKTPIALPFRDNSGMWYEIYNTGYQVNANGLSAPYHKSQLVVAAERMPFRWLLQPLLGKIIVDLGGMTGTHGTQEERAVFTSANGKIKSAPIICWEAEFGDYVTGYTRNGANLFLAITNDGWWGDTDGHRQHMHYARLRAIENRRSVVRSANTGISCFITQRGEVLQPQPWATDAAIRQTIMANEELTFYAKNGDVIGRLAVFFSAILLLYAFVQGYLRKVKV